MNTSKLSLEAQEFYNDASPVFEETETPEFDIRRGLAVALRALAKLKSQEVKVEKTYEYEGTFYFSEGAILVEDILSLANDLEGKS